MTPLSPPHSAGHFIFHTVFLYLLSHLNIVTAWEVLKSPLQTSKNPAKARTLFILHIFFALMFLLMLFSLSMFFSTLHVPTLLFFKAQIKFLLL